jgi:hypothetical protein
MEENQKQDPVVVHVNSITYSNFRTRNVVAAILFSAAAIKMVDWIAPKIVAKFFPDAE